MKKTIQETKVVGCKLPIAECEAIRAVAEREGMTVNKWLKLVLREALEQKRVA